MGLTGSGLRSSPSFGRMFVTSMASAFALLSFAGSASAATFQADPPSLGTITDGPVGGNSCGDFGAPRNVTFTVAGFAGPPSDVQASFALSTVSGAGPGHPWGGDLSVDLIAPGGAPTHSLFHNTSSTTATGCGDGSNVLGTYNFSDSAPASPTWVGAAGATAIADAIPAGSYRAGTPGGVAGGGGANTLISPTFAGLGNPNGVWTLRFRDGGEGDVGAVSSATLTIGGSVDVSPPAVPTLSSTDPGSPADNNSPKVIGSAEAGSTVKLFTTAGCTGNATATGTAAELANPGITATVADRSTTEFVATATDASNNVSACSAPITYTELSPEPEPQPSGDSDPPETTLKKSPKKRSDDRTPTFKFAADEPGSTYECKLDKKPFDACEKKETLRAKPGKHTLFVQATDVSGNVDPTPLRFKFKVIR